MKFNFLNNCSFFKFLLNLFSFIYYKLIIKNSKITKDFFVYITLKKQNINIQTFIKTRSNLINKLKFNFIYNILRYSLEDDKKAAYEFIENYFDVTQSNYKKKNILKINKHFKVLSYKTNLFNEKKFIFHFGSSVSFFNLYLKERFPNKKYFNVDLSKKVTCMNQLLFNNHGIQNINLDCEKFINFLNLIKANNILIYSGYSLCYTPENKIRELFKRLKNFQKVTLIFMEPFSKQQNKFDFSNPLFFNHDFKELSIKYKWLNSRFEKIDKDNLFIAKNF